MVDNFYEVNREGTDLEAIGKAENTYITLGKDILLSRNDNKRYDRIIQSDDYVLMEGMDSLMLAMSIKLGTWFNEMNEIPLYVNFGNRAWFFLKANLTPLHKLELKEEIGRALLDMRRIKTIDSLELFEYSTKGETNPPTLVIDVVVTSISDQVAKYTMEVPPYGI